MKNIAIIPARSGSKGLKDKNIKLLNGKPLMAYTIEAALKSEQFDEVMVSTDSEKYAEIAKAFGAKVPFLRSAETSTDKASSWDTVAEVLGRYAENGQTFDSLCLLQPTSPFRTAEDIKNAYELYNSKADFAVISVCEAEHSPLWCGHLPESGEFLNFINEDAMKQRQAGGKFYRLNGAIYIVNCEKFKTDRYFYQSGSFAYIMPQERSIDIDTNIDFKYAEFLMNIAIC
ncbi:MAG: acylneuraminate cytidylyltransferase family protein [Lachnospiraceae bacterium]|nr:acylneuraminate cytidylyltransferase family protein [Lachnospiraceae bacterium]